MVNRVLIKTAALFGVWVALSGRYSAANLVLGLTLSGGVAWLTTTPMDRLPPRWSVIAACAYLPWLFARVVASSVHMARLILSPGMPINPTIVRYTPKAQDFRAVVVMGNSVTLTPGTITVEAAPDRLVVHAIDEESAADLVSGTLEQKVARIFSHRVGE